MTNDELIARLTQELIDSSFSGKKSPVFISGTNAVSITNGYCIQFKETTVVAAISYAAHGSSDTLAAEEFPAGFTLYLKDITSITLTSGACFVYEK